MNEKKYCYILSKYAFYDAETIIMVSSSCDEIITHFRREFWKLNNGYGLKVTRYEFGKKYNCFDERQNSIQWIEKEDGKITDLMELSKND